MAQTLVTLIRNLQRRNARRRLPLAVAEGVRLVEEAVGAGVAFKGAAVSATLDRTDRGKALRDGLHRAGVPLEEVSDRELDRLADTETPQGVVAVIEHPRWTLRDLAPRYDAPVLVLDAVQDPGNVGTLLRTAYALGAAGVVLLPGGARLVHPKVLRGAMGASFRMPAVTVAGDDFRTWLAQERVTLWVADPGGRPVTALAKPQRLALMVGNEGAGVGPPWTGLADATVGVPIAREVDSLNVAVAAGIILHEVARHD
jgi:TrmH family RNA methyltransferase